MISRIKLFVNNNDKSVRAAKIVRDSLTNNGFVIDDKNFDLGIAVGGDGSFVRMVKECNFSSRPYYVGVHAGTLGFLQEINVDEIDKFIYELQNDMYKVDNIGIQETTINHDNGTSKYYSLNEIIVRDINLKKVEYKVSINDNILEYFNGDGLMIATSVGSTAHNLGYGGSIVFSDFSTLQITPMGPINTEAYRALFYSTIVPPDKNILIEPLHEKQDMLITIDGEGSHYNGVESVNTTIRDKKIKCLRLNHYNFPNRIYEKILAEKK